MHFKKITVHGVEMLPLQPITSLLGVNAPVDSRSKSIRFKYDEINFVIPLGSRIASVNGEEIDMGAEPLIDKSSIYVSAGFIEAVLNKSVKWDEKSNYVTIVVSTKSQISDSTSKSTGGKPGKMSFNVDKSGFIGNLVLVNKSWPVSSKYIPSTLTSVLDKNKKYLIPSKTSSVKLSKEAMNAAITMFKAANNAKIKNLIVSNGYRSYNLQSSYYKMKVNSYKKIYRGIRAEKEASSVVAPPGKSEHQTGLAMDVTSKGLLKTKSPLSESFSSTPEGKWIYQNSWKYGYVVRYRAEKTNITGIISEPWHIRYVGLPHAEIMCKNKLCLEEYLEYVKKTGYIRYKTYSGAEYEISYISVPDSIETFTIDYKSTEKCEVSSYGKNGFIVTKRIK